MSTTTNELADETRRWLAEHAGVPEDAEVRTLAGGNANAAYLLSWPEGRVFLRTPPEGHIDPTAHNLVREHRVLAALGAAGVPVPRPLALCTDAEVPRAPLLVMEHVDGVSITDELPPGYDDTPATLRRLGEELIDALVEIHAVDWRAADLADFGRPEGFLGRQVGRWTAQYERNRSRDLPAFDRVAAALDAKLPADGDITVMHGDYHLDNSLVAPDEPRLLAVIDWEMATLGDPLLDVGLVLALWGDDRPEPYPFSRIQGISRGAGALSREELAARYEAASGRSVARLEIYMALALFKLAAIVEGAYTLYRRGELDSDYARGLEHDVPWLLAQAEWHAARA
jgi:aminoglycoside phosphotransferase (APT) family kinase protein